MKTVIQIILIVFFINSEQVSAQITLPKKKFELLGVQQMVKPVSIPTVIDNFKSVSVSAFKVELPKVGLNLGEQLEKVKRLCPMLQAKTTIDLKADREDKSNVLLQWKVVNGNNSRQFEIERSLGDSLHFEMVNVEWPNAKAASKEKYELADNNDCKLVSYYRVKLLLISGEVVYSNIADVKGYRNDKVSLFPNPAVKKLSVTSDFDGMAITAITVLDFSGKIMQHHTNGWSTKQQSFQLDVSQLIPGMYSIKLQLADNTYRTVKFIKQ
jgi:hypothetical protein